MYTFLAHGDPDLECNICGKVYASKYTLRAHKKLHDRKFPCERCTRTYSVSEDLRNHMISKHGIFTCDECNYTSRDYEDLKTHQLTHEPNYKDTTEAELVRFFCDDDMNGNNINSYDPDWKLDHDINDNYTPENIDPENQKYFKDDDRDKILQETEDFLFVPRGAHSDIHAEKNGFLCYEDSIGDEVMAKVMSNSAFLGKKTKKNKRFSKVCSSNKHH